MLMKFQLGNKLGNGDLEKKSAWGRETCWITAFKKQAVMMTSGWNSPTVYPNIGLRTISNCVWFTFITDAVCVTTTPQPLAKPVLYTVRYTASSFSFWYPLLFLRPFCSCLLPLSRLPVPTIFPSITCFRRQFLRKMWPTQLAFFHFIICTIFLSFCSVCNTSSFFT